MKNSIAIMCLGFLLAFSMSACGDDEDFLNSVTYRDMISVPGGTFTQTVVSGGGPFSHTITGFKMGKYQVTYELWYTVKTWAATNEYLFANPGTEGSHGVIGSPPTEAKKYQPVTTINWRDAIVWCNAYSQMVGLTPVYCSDSGCTKPIKDSRDGSYSASINTTEGSVDTPFVKWEATGYRLPTEGQWQYAASYRDGSIWTPHTWASGATADFNNADACAAVAWYQGNAEIRTQAVGTRLANQLGFFDMAGNVWEWCWDFSPTLPTAAQVDYRGASSGIVHVIRGGSYSVSANILQLGFRSTWPPYNEDGGSGFRVSLP